MAPVATGGSARMLRRSAGAGGETATPGSASPPPGARPVPRPEGGAPRRALEGGALRHAPTRGGPRAAPRPERRPSLVGASTVALSGFSALRTPITQRSRARSGARGRGRWHEGAAAGPILGVVGRLRAPAKPHPVVAAGSVNEVGSYSGRSMRESQ